MTVERRSSGLFIARNFGFLRHRKRERSVILPTGERAKVTVDDSGTVTQVETNEQLHGIVSPKTVTLRLGKGSLANGKRR
jgi:hypothetical protein